MDQVSQGENSHTQLLLHVKKRRGRPRKDPSLKFAQAACVTPGFQLKQEYLPQRADRTVSDIMVGQAVTGVVEATFDGGYLLTVRIGNSNTNLRAVAFKPDCYTYVTAETDVAPHLQMIRRNEARFPAEDQGLSHGQKLSVQTIAGGLLPLKRKHASPVTPAPPVGVRGTVVPVVLQPINLSNRLLSSHQMPSDATRALHMMASVNKDEHVSKSLATLPPDQTIPVSQIFMATGPSSSHQVKGSEHNDNGSLNYGTSEVGLEDKSKTMKSSDIDTTGSLHSTATQVENGSERWRSSLENSSVESKEETGNISEPFLTKPLQSTFITQPLFNYGAGRMTELLKAMQENIRYNPLQIAENFTFVSQIEFLASRTMETRPKNGANIP